MNINEITFSLVQAVQGEKAQIELLIAVAKQVGGDPVKLIADTVKNKLDTCKEALSNTDDKVAMLKAVDELQEILAILKTAIVGFEEPAILETMPEAMPETSVVPFNNN